MYIYCFVKSLKSSLQLNQQARNEKNKMLTRCMIISRSVINYNNISSLVYK